MSNDTFNTLDELLDYLKAEEDCASRISKRDSDTHYGGQAAAFEEVFGIITDNKEALTRGMQEPQQPLRFEDNREGGFCILDKNGVWVKTRGDAGFRELVFSERGHCEELAKRLNLPCEFIKAPVEVPA